jgi:hypothetical protein
VVVDGRLPVAYTASSSRSEARTEIEVARSVNRILIAPENDQAANSSDSPTGTTTGSSVPMREVNLETNIFRTIIDSLSSLAPLTVQPVTTEAQWDYTHPGIVRGGQPRAVGAHRGWLCSPTAVQHGLNHVAIRFRALKPLVVGKSAPATPIPPFGVIGAFSRNIAKSDAALAGQA